MDVFPTFGKDAHKLEEAMGNARNQVNLDNISIIEFFSYSHLGGLLRVCCGFCSADAACEYDRVIDKGIPFPCKEVGFRELCE